MRRTRALAYSVLALGVTAALAAADRPAVDNQTAAAPLVPGLSYRFEKVADGVFCAIASGVPYYVANSAVIVGDDGVLVVDTGAGPNEARVLRDAIRTITDRPVRYVVDTHFHFDHALGNWAFPEAAIIGHEATRALLGPDAPSGKTVAAYLAGLPAQIENARAEAEKEASPEKRAEAMRRADALRAYQEELARLIPTAPQLTFRETLTLWLGSREVRLLHLGRGHTAGDVVVFLPQQRVACTGDLFNGYIGYMGDAYVDEWADTLDRLATLDFETVIPGHGVPFKGKDAIVPVQACLRDLWHQAEALKRSGVAADEAAGRIDLRARAGRFPRLAQLGFDPVAVRRIYEVIDSRAAAASTR
jgi:cyclase